MSVNTWQEKSSQPVADSLMQRLLVVDEAEVSRLTDEASGVTRLHAGLALLRDQQPQGAERRPAGRRRHVGGPHQSGGVGSGHEERTSAGPPATSGGAVSGQVGGDERRLRAAEVLHTDPKCVSSPGGKQERDTFSCFTSVLNQQRFLFACCGCF